MYPNKKKIIIRLPSKSDSSRISNKPKSRKSQLVKAFGAGFREDLLSPNEQARKNLLSSQRTSRLKKLKLL